MPLFCKYNSKVTFQYAYNKIQLKSHISIRIVIALNKCDFNA